MIFSYPWKWTKQNILQKVPNKFVLGSSHNQSRIDHGRVPTAGSNIKEIITAAFTIAMNGVFLPIQLVIYNDKTSKSLQQVNFPSPPNLSITE